MDGKCNVYKVQAVACSLATAGAFLAADNLRSYKGATRWGMHVTPVVPQKRAKKTT